MPPKRSVLKLYLCGVSPLKCPTSSLRHSSYLSPSSCHCLRSSRPPLRALVLLGVRIKCLPRLQSFSKDGWRGWALVSCGTHSVPAVRGRARGPSTGSWHLRALSTCKLQAIISYKMWPRVDFSIMAEEEVFNRPRPGDKEVLLHVKGDWGRVGGSGVSSWSTLDGPVLLRISRSVL